MPSIHPAEPMASAVVINTATLRGCDSANQLAHDKRRQECQCQKHGVGESDESETTHPNRVRWTTNWFNLDRPALYFVALG